MFNILKFLRYTVTSALWSVLSVTEEPVLCRYDTGVWVSILSITCCEAETEWWSRPGISSPVITSDHHPYNLISIVTDWEGMFSQNRQPIAFPSCALSFAILFIWKNSYSEKLNTIVSYASFLNWKRGRINDLCTVQYNMHMCKWWNGWNKCWP